MSDIIKKSIITIEVGLDDNNVPIAMEWNASDAPNHDDKQPCKAMLLSLFDKEHLDTLKIDLWTKDMQIMEMDRFFFQTLKGMADTYYQATQNRQLASEMQQFVQYFGQSTGIINSEETS